MTVEWRKYKLQLKTPFVLSYGAFDYRWAFIVSIEDEGCIGLGEATAISYYGWKEDDIQLQLESFQSAFEEGRAIDVLLNQMELSPPVRNAIQCAYCDVQARKSGHSLSTFYHLPNRMKEVESSITISGQTFMDLDHQIRDYDWDAFKIKMGSANDQIKLDIMAAHPSKKFRIDANAGWNMDWVSQHIDALNADNIELIEQPFPVDESKLNLEFRKLIDKPVFADEACRDVVDVAECAKYFDGINVKLMKCGGWDRTLEMMEEAQRCNLKIMLGCMTESSIGVSHAAQLLSMVDVADIDGAVLISNDPAKGMQLERGKVILPNEPGCGASLLD